MGDDAQSTKSLNNAADLAERQLEHAIQVARAAGFESEPTVLAAILQGHRRQPLEVHALNVGTASGGLVDFRLRRGITYCVRAASSATSSGDSARSPSFRLHSCTSCSASAA